MTRASLMLALALGALGVGLAACPGSAQRFDLDYPDGDTPVPDAAIEAEAAAPQRLVITTWNVENLFNDVADSPEAGLPCAPGETTSCETVVTSAEYQARVAAVAAALEPLGSDVVVMQEVENAAVLDAVAEAVGGLPHRVHVSGNDPRGIDVVLASRFPVDRVVSHKGEFFEASTDPTRTFVFARDCLEVHLTVNGRHLALLGVHLKAFDDADSNLKRLAEAEQIRRIATGVHLADAEAGIVVLGDFNAEPGEPPLLALLGEGATAWTSAATLVPEADRYSYGGSRLIDDQLVNPVAAAWLEAASIDHSAAVAAASDHSPVTASYQVR